MATYQIPGVGIVSFEGTYQIPGVGVVVIPAAAGGGTLKTGVGLAIASIKTFNGLAIASTKTKNGLATV